MKKVILYCLFILSALGGSLMSTAQEVIRFNAADQDIEQQIDIDQFNPLLCQFILLNEVNLERKKMGLDVVKAEKALTIAARNLARDLAEDEYYKLDDPDMVGDYCSEAGSNFNVSGLSYRVSVKLNGEYISYKSLVDAIIQKWSASRKTSGILFSPGCIFVGFGAELDELGRKVYIAMTSGNYYSFDNPEPQEEDLGEFPPEDKDYGLNPYDKKACKNVPKYSYFGFQKGLFIKDEIIYIKTNQLKQLKKIIKTDSKDGLAIDLVQKDQYECGNPNIVDYNWIHRGILTKPVYANKIYDHNEIEGKEAKTTLLVELGELPYDFPDNPELNLLIIKDKNVCLSVPPTPDIKTNFKPFEDIEYLADTVSINTSIDFIPEAVDDEFILRFPFSKGNSGFSFEKDILPKLKTLNAPPFLIKEVNIAAFTSIEASSNRDMIKIHNESEQLVEEFQKYQEAKIASDIITSNAWDLFRNDVIGTEYEYLAFKDPKEAIKEIKDNHLAAELEPIFKNHRFAQVQVKVVYDLSGENEEEYVLHHFNTAIENEKLPLALSIQKYIIKSVLSNKYNSKAVMNQRIPLEDKFAGLLMNKLWLQFHLALISEDEFYSSLEKLKELAPSNQYIAFNYLNAAIQFEELYDDYTITKIQDQIEKLYQFNLSKSTIDALNLEYQFKVIATLDTLNKPSDLLFQSLERIKNLSSLDDFSWKNSLQLAQLFIDHKDYKFATRLLEVYVEDTNVNEELLFTYLELGAYAEYKFMTPRFESALAKANDMNPKRLCNLFKGSNKFAYRFLENPNVKAVFCNSCK